MKKFLSLLILMTLFLRGGELPAQTLSHISGRVTDRNNAPIVGATIIIAGTTRGTSTDAEGKYVLQCPADATLQFSFIGYTTFRTEVRGRRVIDAALDISVVAIDEVVAIGYGTIQRKDLTGSVASVSGRQIQNIPVTDISQALIGRIAGVNIRPESGALDAGISIQVRGGTSLTQDNSPLYIIDGVPSEEGLTGLDATNIESIDILKDASTTAIYGSRGANGVILITTKNAKAEGFHVKYQGSFGVSRITNTLDVLGAADYVRLEFERYTTGEEREKIIRRYGDYEDIDRNYPAGSGVNWQKATFGESAPFQSHSVSLSGGSKTSKFTASYTHDRQDGIMVNSWKSRDMLRFKYNFMPSKKLMLSTNISYSETTTQGSGSLANHKSTLTTMVKYRPTAGLEMSASDFINATEDPAIVEDDPTDEDTRNPVVTAKYETNKKTTRLLTGSVQLGLQLAKDLRYEGSVSYSRNQYQSDRFYAAGHPKANKTTGPYGNISQTYSDRLVYNNTLSFSRKFNKRHNFDLLVGQEYIVTKGYGYGFGGSGFPNINFGLDNMDLATVGDIPSSSRAKENQLSFFLRTNYTLMNKYLFTVTMRTDGSSKFGNNHKWGFFPAAAFAWKINQEKLVRDWNVFSDLKLRLSYGTTGNNRINNYNSLDLFASGQIAMNENLTTYYESTKIANPDLKWETNITANIALDMAFLNNRIGASVELYHTKTKDLLMSAQVPYTTGYTTIMKNIGSVRNQGLEIMIDSYNIVKKNFSWRTQFNIAFNRTKVLALAESDYLELTSSWNNNTKTSDYLVKVGSPLGLVYGYVSDGIYTVDDFNYDSSTDTWTLKEGVPYVNDLAGLLKPGYPKYKNIDESADNLISTSDKAVIGRTEPDFFGGLNNTFTFWNFDLSVFLNFTVGNDIYNANKMAYSALNARNKNTLKSAYEGHFITVDERGNSLMKNPEKLRAYNENATNPSTEGSNSLYLSDKYIESGSFLRLNNITVGYTLPKKILSKLRLQTLRVYASFYNLATITGYSGFDPEVNMLSDRNGSMTSGLDYGAHPREKRIVFGLNISF